MTLDHETIEQDRLEAGEHAVVKPDVAASRAWAYEVLAAKEVRPSLDAVMALEAAEVVTLAPEVRQARISALENEAISESELVAGFSLLLNDLGAVLDSFGSGANGSPRMVGLVAWPRLTLPGAGVPSSFVGVSPFDPPDSQKEKTHLRAGRVQAQGCRRWNFRGQ